MAQIKPTGDHLNAGSDATPQALGTAGAGTSVSYSRADHVHAMPSASDVGALGATASAGGDLSGSYPNPTVAKINTHAVASTTPASGQVLTWDGTQWAPATNSSGGGGGANGLTYYLRQDVDADAPTTNIPGTPKQLGRTGSETATSITTGTLTTGQWTLFGGYVSEATPIDPDVAQIPGGLWDFNLWAYGTANANAGTVIRAKVYVYNGTDVPTLLGTSGEQVINNASAQFSLSVLVPQTSVSLTDRIYVAIEVKASANGHTATLQFGDGQPSHVHTSLPLVGGTGLWKSVAGVLQSPASYLTNADVATDAAIAQSKIANLTTDLAGKVSTSQLGVANGVATLDSSGKLSTSQAAALTTAQIAQITPSAIGAVPTTRSVSTTDGLTGGGALSGDLTLQLTTTGVASGIYGSLTKIPALTIDEKGRVTAATEYNAPSGTPADVQVFTSSATWTKQAGAKAVNIQLLAGGGGGGSGRKDPSTTVVHCGGGGGSGGSYLNITLPADAISASVAVTVGAGGAGGAAQTATANGNNGSPGESTIFDGIIATGGSAGVGGSITLGSGGAAALSSNVGGSAATNGGSGGGGAPTAAIGVTWAYGGPGGGAGGGISTANVGFQAGSGGRSNAINIAGGSGGNAGGVSGGNGTANSNASTGLLACGSGGGGGGGNPTGNGGNGGNGGFPAAGGGGGGATSGGTQSGAGGNGAAGMAIITTYF